jgi:uncharacterized protein (DUF427 family)
VSTRLQVAMMSDLAELRHEPSPKRIRAAHGDRVVVDSTRAMFVWEPRRVVSSWAVPVDDVAGELLPARAPTTAAPDDVGYQLPDVSPRPVLDPSIPFAVHTANGRVVDLHADADVLAGAGLLLDDPDLEGYVVLDFAAFDTWWEEDDINVGHPREPFHRIDVLPSSRHVRFELDGQVLADSTRAQLLVESMLPVRFYLPREDVVADLVASPTRTTCAYKGHASYWSPVVGGREVPDLAWSYEQPLREAAQVAGRVAFFDEKLDVVVDGVRRERPVTPWS